MPSGAPYAPQRVYPLLKATSTPSCKDLRSLQSPILGLLQRFHLCSRPYGTRPQVPYPLPGAGILFRGYPASPLISPLALKRVISKPVNLTSLSVQALQVYPPGYTLKSPLPPLIFFFLEPRPVLIFRPEALSLLPLTLPLYLLNKLFISSLKLLIIYLNNSP